MKLSLFSICVYEVDKKINGSCSTKSDGKLTSLDQYISRMKSGQKDIFYITGTSKEQLEKSPFLERLKKKNYEVPVNHFLWTSFCCINFVFGLSLRI